MQGRAPLHSLYLHNCSVHAGIGFGALCTRLLQSPSWVLSLRNLVVSRNKLGGSGSRHLGGFVRASRALRTLIAFNCELDCKVILQSVRGNLFLESTLHHLDLSFNKCKNYEAGASAPSIHNVSRQISKTVEW